MRTIPDTESLTVEFKSDKNCLPDNDLIAAIVCLAIPSRQSSLGLLDYSALPIPEARADDLDPIERARLRRMIEIFKGDTTLLSLTDDELDGALGLTRTINEQRIPTLTGLLLIGKESAIRTHIPTHEVSFQVLDNTQVRVNDFYRIPLEDV